MPTHPTVPLWHILKRRSVMWITVGCFCQGIVRDGISLWAAIFFIEAYGLQIRQAILFVLIIPVANFASVLGIGWLYKRSPLRLDRLAALTFMIGALMTGALFLMWHAGATVAIVLLAIASATMSAANALLLGVYPLLFAEEDHVSGVSGYLEFCTYLAAGCTAVLSGLLLDRMGWQSVILLWLSVALVGCAALLLAERAKIKE